MSRPQTSAGWLPGLTFVLIWSTGFIVGKAIVPLADTTLFLLARFALAALMFCIAALAARAAWPAWRDVPRHLLAGALMQGLYLCAAFGAVAHGLPPAVMALLGALQPLLTALLAIPLLKELPSRRTWQGLATGVAGVALVVVPVLQAGVGRSASIVSPWVMLAGLLAIVSITMGTLLQKMSIAASDLRTSSAWQNVGAMLVAGLAVWLSPAPHWQPGPVLWAALGWAALGISGAGTWLLLGIVRRGQAAGAAALMFLAPPLAAVQAWLLFGDRLAPLQWLGMAVAGAGVWLCQTRERLRHATAR